MSKICKVTFNLKTHVEFGQQVEITGAEESLGMWGSSRPLDWNDGDVWTCECDLAPGVLEYKYVVKSSTGDLITWQPGENRKIEVPEDCDVQVVDDWDASQPTKVEPKEFQASPGLTAEEDTPKPDSSAFGEDKEKIGSLQAQSETQNENQAQETDAEQELHNGEESADVEEGEYVDLAGSNWTPSAAAEELAEIVASTDAPEAMADIVESTAEGTAAEE